MEFQARNTRVFDPTMQTHTHWIEAYGAVRLGQGADTITLTSCDAVAVQLIGDRHAVRLNVGSTLPVSGVHRVIRNPYSRPVRIEYLLGMPVQYNPASTELEQGMFHIGHLGYRTEDSGPVPKGTAILAKRGGFRFELNVWGHTRVSLIPSAKQEYVSSIPAGALAETPSVTASDGYANENYIVRTGDMSDQHMMQWIQASGWPAQIAPIMRHNSLLTGYAAPGTALVVRTDPDYGHEINAVFHDMGDWNPEYSV